MPLYVRVRGPNGVEQGVVEDGRVVLGSDTRVTPLDPDSLHLPEPYELLTPLAAPEIWCAGVTYERSRDARVEESAVKDVYTMVYDAPRPELFLKDAAMRRTVAPGRPIGIRGDSTWNVPEPEIGVVLGTNGRIVGYTIGNDVSSRDIEGANPLYLPQAKIYAGACSFGPAVFVPDDDEATFHLSLRVTDEWGRIVFEGESFTSTMRRSFADLVGWLLVDNPVPPGSILLTGTGLVPPDDFTLLPGHFVEIRVPQIGTLVNPVVRASELIQKEDES
ncbi:MAG TPA: fumarylacetoacetate hydrolase family protein [Gaiellaceae bacterium]|nr:fumarylacetoacetate hydrolase family protein [Gaiellaceae bacterium]